MKARLIIHYDNYVLLKCNGEIDRIPRISARDFLLNYSNDEYLPERDTWYHDGFTIDSYPGKTVAYVNAQNELIIQDPLNFKDIIISGETDFLTVTEYASLHGKSVATVRKLCKDGKMPGAIMVGNYYVIPANTPYPIK